MTDEPVGALYCLMFDRLRNLVVWRAAILFLFLSVCMPLPAQESTPTLSDRRAATGFRQEFNSYLWTADLHWLQILSPQWRFSFHESYKTSLLHTTAEGKRWKDDQNLQLELTRSFSSGFQIFARANSLQFFDKQSGYANDLQSASAALGALWTPHPSVDIRLACGPKRDQRLGHDDRGIWLGSEARGEGLRWLDYDHRWAASFDQDRFPLRRNSNLSTLYQIGRTFAPGVSDSLRFVISDRRRDNYLSESADIESQRENIKGGNNILHYRLNEAMRVSYTTQLEFKSVELAHLREKSQSRRRRRLDQKIANDAALEWQLSSWKGQLSLSHLVQQQQYDLATDGDRPFSSRIAFVTPDNKSSRFILSALIRHQSENDSLTFSASANKFRYDTPDTSNFDDRDELRINTRLVWAHRLSSELSTEWTAGVNLYHMVYIYGERSADNNWNRIIFIKPNLTFSPSNRFAFHQSLEVLANYVDYDFEESFAATRSFVFRKFSAGDSLYWRILPFSALIVDYRLQLEENGQLFWERWSERIVGTRSLQWLHVYWQYERGSFRSRAGYAVFKRHEQRCMNDAFGKSRREPAGSYISRGPVLSLSYISAKNLRMQIEAARSLVHASAQKPYYVTSIDLSAIWHF